MKKIFLILLSVMFVFTLFTGCQAADNNSEKPDNDSVTKTGDSEIFFVIKTEKGDIKGVLYPDVAPNTVLNFVTLAREGFYDGLTFHRVEPGFVIQGGDPKGNGTGDPGYSIPAEFNEKRHITGTLAMARSEHPDSAGCQFYICLAPAPNLNGNYTVFGQVTEGLEIVQQIEVGDKFETIVIEGDLPKDLQGKEVEKGNF